MYGLTSYIVVYLENNFRKKDLSSITALLLNQLIKKRKLTEKRDGSLLHTIVLLVYTGLFLLDATTKSIQNHC